jgi:hypothetical protein
MAKARDAASLLERCFGEHDAAPAAPRRADVARSLPSLTETRTERLAILLFDLRARDDVILAAAMRDLQRTHQ